MIRVNGNGFDEYFTAFSQGRIKPTEFLYIKQRAHDVNWFVIDNTGGLTSMVQEHQEAKVNPAELLSKEKWFVTMNFLTQEQRAQYLK